MFKTPMIAVIDDDPSWRRLTCICLNEAFGQSVQVVEFESVEASASSLMRGSLDVVILDVRMPGVSGANAVTYVRRLDQSVGIVVMTGSDEAELMWEVLAYGAIDFCRKDALSENLPSMVASAYQRVAQDDGRFKDVYRRLDALTNVVTSMAESLKEFEKHQADYQKQIVRLGWGALSAIGAIALVVIQSAVQSWMGR